jgi:hypothetical protein
MDNRATMQIRLRSTQAAPCRGGQWRWRGHVGHRRGSSTDFIASLDFTSSFSPLLNPTTLNGEAPPPPSLQAIPGYTGWCALVAARPGWRWKGGGGWILVVGGPCPLHSTVHIHDTLVPSNKICIYHIEIMSSVIYLLSQSEKDSNHKGKLNAGERSWNSRSWCPAAIFCRCRRLRGGKKADARHSRTVMVTTHLEGAATLELVKKPAHGVSFINGDQHSVSSGTGVGS